MPALKELLGAALGRIVSPQHLFEALKLQRSRKRDRQAHDDAQLKFYADVLPQDYLHFGYFNDPSISPERTSVGDVFDAQHRYAEKVLEHVVDREHPVMDVGCGMGGLTGMLLARGFQPIAVTPDRFQVRHVAQKFPAAKVIRSRFEALDITEYAGRIGTVLNSESLQYLKLDAAIEQVKKLLLPGGRWVVCDFFYRYVCQEKSCHVWDDFVERINRNGLKITFQEDITQNVLPMHRFVHMWATRLGIPMMEFARLKFARKQPGLSYLLQDVMSRLQSTAVKQMDKVNAELFQERHRYMLLVMERQQPE